MYDGRAGKNMRKRLISICNVAILVFSIYGCAQTAEETSTTEPKTVETENTETKNREAADTENAETEIGVTNTSEEEYEQNEEETKLIADISEQGEQPEAVQSQWQVYIQPDMPEPFIKVLKQYEDFMNADLQSVYDDDVCSKLNIIDGEWYLCHELCEALKTIVELYEEEAAAELGIYSYSLTDLTGDGFPELIMGRDSDIDADYLYAVYYYSETEEIKMVDTTRYFDMSLYEGGIIEYISGGMD